MKQICTKCGEPYDEFGALVFSPPQAGTDHGATCTKHHVCAGCWTALHAWLGLPADNLGVRFTIVQADDWAGLYDNGILAYEGHTVREDDLQRVMGDAPLTQLERRCVTDEYLEDLHARGNLPRALIDVGLQVT